MGQITETFEINAGPEKVFEHMDDIRNMGPHMHSFGGNLNLDIVSQNATGVGATYHWRGTFFGWKVDFAEVVTKWELNREKAYRGVKGFKFDLHWVLTPKNGATNVSVELDYELPGSWLGKIADRAFVGRYVKRGFFDVFREMKGVIEGGNAG